MKDSKVQKVQMKNDATDEYHMHVSMCWNGANQRRFQLMDNVRQ